MQAKLPDINAAFVKYRTHALECINSRNYNGAAASLYNINALFPDEYRVSISNEMYSKESQNRKYYKCNYCEKEIPYSEVRILSILNTWFNAILSKNKHIRIWICPECKQDNSLKSTKIISEKMARPFYLKVVPICPVRLRGISTRSIFHQNFSNWFYGFLEELEYQLGLYRIEYVSQEEKEQYIDAV